MLGDDMFRRCADVIREYKEGDDPHQTKLTAKNSDYQPAQMALAA